MLKPREEVFSASQIPEISDGVKWYCAVVKSGQAQAARSELYSLGYVSFVPEARKWRSHARKCLAIYRPVPGMASYLFVAIDYPRQSFAAVKDVRGVAEIMSTAGRPIPFTGTDVSRFMFRMLKGEWDEVEGVKVPVGARVVVVDGPHENKEAVVTAVRGKKIFAKVEGQAAVSTFFASNVRAA